GAETLYLPVKTGETRQKLAAQGAAESAPAGPICDCRQLRSLRVYYWPHRPGACGSLSRAAATDRQIAPLQLGFQNNPAGYLSARWRNADAGPANPHKTRAPHLRPRASLAIPAFPYS